MNQRNYNYNNYYRRKNNFFSHQVVTPFFLLLSILLSGCMKEDYSLCVDLPDTTLKINFTYTETGITKFTDVIQKVDVVIFDEELQFYRMLSVNQEKLVEATETSFAIDPGTYYIVGWGNVEGNSGMSALNAESLFAESFISHTGENTIDSLYYAPDTRAGVASAGEFIRYQVVVPENELTEHTLPFMGAYHTINVYITGLDGIEDPKTNKPEIRIQNLSSRYNYHLEYTEDETIDFQRISRLASIEQKPQLFAGFLVPHFQNKNDIRVQVVRELAGNERIDEVLLEEFLEKENITITDGGKHIINIEFQYDENLFVKAIIPDWAKKDVNPGFD